MGRWLSPDPYMGSHDFSNPQSFNRYAYVNNNPLVATDPSGLKENDSTDINTVDDGWDTYCTPDLPYCGSDPFPEPGGPSGPLSDNSGAPTPAPPVKDPYKRSPVD